MSKNKERKPVTNLYTNIYPESVRYALKYKQGQMGNEEVESLVLSGKINEAIYFICKLLEDDIGLQSIFILELTIILTRIEDNIHKEVISTLKNWLNKLPKDKTVKGNKLAQINRGGSELWQEKFANLAQKSIKVDGSATPHLLAYATMLGFAEFIKAYKNNPECQEIAIIVPEWIEDDDRAYIGYRIDLNNNKVTLYDKDLPLINNPHFIDDTVKTGATLEKIQQFWQVKTGEIIDNGRIFVVTNLT